MLVVLSLMVLSAVAMLAAGSRGTVKALPLFTFLVILMPVRAAINLGALFDLNMQRLLVLLLLVIYLKDREPLKDEEGQDLGWFDIPFVKLILGDESSSRKPYDTTMATQGPRVEVL